MKIIISPTKTMKRKNYTDKKTKAIFKEKSLQLRTILETYDKKQIKEDFKISDKLTDLVFKYYQKPKSKIAAINLYEGLAFKNIKVENFDESDFNFIEKHLYIMSAMYGALRPFDEIVEYRLDYMMKFETNLYDFWKEPLEKLLEKEELIINLASNEFLQSINHPKIINIHLLDEKGRNLSTQAKIGRGNMLAYIVKHKIKDVERLKDYSHLNYKFDNKKSDVSNYYFIKE